MHPFTSKPQDHAGIPTPFEGKGPPAESQGTPSHPVESKVSDWYNIVPGLLRYLVLVHYP